MRDPPVDEEIQHKHVKTKLKTTKKEKNYICSDKFTG
jgi:hypothetical protein